MPRAKTEDEIDRLLELATGLLITNAIAGAGGAISFSRLAKDSRYARQTVHAHLKSGRAALAGMAERLCDLEASNFRQVMDDVMRSYEDSRGSDQVELFQRLLGFNFARQFSNPAVPVGWILQSAAIPHSPAWAGQPRPSSDPESRRAALAILDARRRLYEHAAEELRHLLALAIRSLGRVPRPDTTVDEIVMALNSLNDGLVLRETIEPGRIDPETAGRILYHLAESMTIERGTAYGEGRPEDPTRAEVFDQITEAALALWSEVENGEPGPTLQQIAAASGLELATVTLLFSDAQAVHQAAARTLFPTAELAAAVGHPYPIPLLQTALDALATAADDCRPLVRSLQPDDGMVAELVDTVAQSLEIGGQRGKLSAPNPSSTARALVGFALQGEAGRPAVRALLETIAPADGIE